METVKKIKTYNVIGISAFKGFNFRFTKIKNSKYFLLQDIRKVYSKNVLDLLDSPPLYERVTFGTNSQFRYLVNLTMLRSALDKVSKILEIEDPQTEQKAKKVLNKQPAVKPRNIVDKPPEDKKTKEAPLPEVKPVQAEFVTALSQIVDKCIRSTPGPVVKQSKPIEPLVKKAEHMHYGVPRVNVDASVSKEINDNKIPQYLVHTPARGSTYMDILEMRKAVSNCLTSYATALFKKHQKTIKYEQDQLRVKVYLSCYAEFDDVLTQKLEPTGKTLKSLGLGKLDKNQSGSNSTPYLERVKNAGYLPLMLEIALKHYNPEGL